MAAEKVLVTGAGGFIALHCIQQLLEAGYHVRGTLRNVLRQSEVREALGIAPTKRRLSFIACDLRLDTNWDEAMMGMDYVLHIASPFPSSVPKNEAEIIIPARDGSLRVLTAAKKAGIKRVILTSSTAAIMSGTDKPIYTEKDWSDIDSPNIGAYEKSKTITERTAWDFVKDNKGPELTVINPGAVLGPLINHHYSASADIVRLLMNGSVPAIPRVGFTLVDVRDVASAHIAAMKAPHAAGERFMCCLDQVWMKEIAEILDTEYGAKGWNIPTKTLPDMAVKVGAKLNTSLQRIMPNLGRERIIDNSKIRMLLDWNPRDVEEMTLAMAESLINHGIISKS